MDPTNEADFLVLQRKAKLAKYAAVVFFFLLAFFWSVGTFLIWLLLGPGVYFVFLALYYNSLAKTDLGSDSPSGVPGPIQTILKRSIGIILLSLAGLTTLILVLKMSSSPSESGSVNADQPNAEPLPNQADIIDSLTNLGNDLYNQGKYDSAMIYYDRVLILEADNKFAMYDKALVFYAKKDYVRSIPILYSCIRQDPGYGDAFWLLGDVYIERHDPDSARICLDLGYETGLRTGSFLQLMASLYENVDSSRAIELYKESIQQDSTLIESYRKLATLEPSRAEEYQKAIKALGGSVP